jgi:hypothetical protein
MRRHVSCVIDNRVKQTINNINNFYSKCHVGILRSSLNSTNTRLEPVGSRQFLHCKENHFERGDMPQRTVNYFLPERLAIRCLRAAVRRTVNYTLHSGRVE